jgi:3-methyladenine DNA glycosylase AlkD
MTKTEVMKELEANGTAQNRKVYRRHGVLGEMFGVSYAALGKLKKTIKIDQPLAEQLWKTGNHDARILATMIADPSKTSGATLDAWVKDVDNRTLAGAVSNVAAEAPTAKSRMEKWTASRKEMVACTGWHTLASIARRDNDLPDAYFASYLDAIESTVHTSPNWAKHAMNNALINIGVRNPALEKKATAAAKRIGKIDVDHGETGCKTPDAAAYIKKTLTHRKKKSSR